MHEQALRDKIEQTLARYVVPSREIPDSGADLVLEGNGSVIIIEFKWSSRDGIPLGTSDADRLVSNAELAIRKVRAFLRPAVAKFMLVTNRSVPNQTRDFLNRHQVHVWTSKREQDLLDWLKRHLNGEGPQRSLNRNLPNLSREHLSLVFQVLEQAQTIREQAMAMEQMVVATGSPKASFETLMSIETEAQQLIRDCDRHVLVPNDISADVLNALSSRLRFLQASLDAERNRFSDLLRPIDPDYPRGS
ncbi:MAG TPA: hypothetical protein VK464_12205 [Symbiobacteriaceae bacterium]|jgi:hypothetical protein|nr:hypothetical protein [Symbiobacteriaceae bacterium]